LLPNQKLKEARQLRLHRHAQCAEVQEQVHFE
jgi:hypothetical protein